MKPLRLRVLVLVSALALTVSLVPAQTRAKLADYYTALPQRVIDASYLPNGIANGDVTKDLNGDGFEDLVVLGAYLPKVGPPSPQPGRVFLGDGNLRFSPAPSSLFPVDTLMTVMSRKVLFADFNDDGRPDMFISSTGWDAPPFPGEQNRLYLSRPEGGWRDATDNLPPLADFSHTSATGDLSGRGLIDIFVGNGYASTSLTGPYSLLNTGSGQFTQTTTNIPVGRNQLLAPLTSHSFPGATLTDLNDDGLPELIVTADDFGSRRFRRTSIFWNSAGIFADTDVTELPAPDVFQDARHDYDVQRIDVNRDGLPDLVVIGSPNSLDGWFVQILVNHGDRRFVDETAARVPQGQASGRPTWPRWVRVLDFNHDGAPDFSVEFAQSTGMLERDQPLIWLNDGAGGFSTLKAGDFVPAANSTWDLGNGHLVATPNGYSFIHTWINRPGGLTVNGMLATRPYRVTTGSLAPHE